MKKALVVLAPGFEETEAVQPIDLLRRAGIIVHVAGLSGGQVTGSHGITLVADLLLGEVEDSYDVLILPGGMPGAQYLADSPTLDILLRTAWESNQLVAAICAAPAVVLGSKGLLAGRKFTCFPGMEGGFKDSQFLAQAVVVDGQLITSRGLGTSGAFGLAIVEALVGASKAREVGERALVI